MTRILDARNRPPITPCSRCHGDRQHTQPCRQCGQPLCDDCIEPAADWTTGQTCPLCSGRFD